GGLVEERGALAAGDVLGPDGRRPQPAGPPARAQRLVAGRRVGLVPVHALPARLLAEGRPVVAVPGVGARHPQRAAGLALLSGVKPSGPLMSRVTFTSSMAGTRRREFTAISSKRSQSSSRRIPLKSGAIASRPSGRSDHGALWRS